MNKCYRLVWNSTLQAWTVACEFAKARGKAGRGLALKALVSTGVLIGAMAGVEPANAWVAETGTSSPALDGGIASNTSINGGIAIATMNAIAMGPSATASGINAFAAGIGSLASGRSSFAMGEAAQATNTDTIALGHNAAAKSTNLAHSDMIAIGLNANASSDHAMAIGTGAAAKNSNSLAVGSNAIASGDASSAFGHNANASGSSSTALGLNATASKGSSVAIGYQSNSAADNSAAIGYQAASLATNSLAFGNGAKAQAGATNAIAIGNAASASTGAINAIALGNGATSAATGGVAVGNLSQANASNTLAAGVNAQAGTANSIAMGLNAKVDGAGTDAVAIGNGANVSSNAAGFVAIGSGASAKGNVGAVAIGRSTLVWTGAVAIGDQAQAYNNDAVSIGSRSSASGGTDTVALGTSAIAGSHGSMSLGAYSKSNGERSTALGGYSNAVSQGTALGFWANATVDSAVALGLSSVASTDAGIAGYDASTKLASTNASPTWKSTLAAVSVGDVASGKTRQINSVAAGSVDTDAVNVAQLKASQSHYYSVNDGGVAGGNYNNDGAIGLNALAAGVGASAGENDSVAIGHEAKANFGGDVALGAGSVTDVAVGTSGVGFGGPYYGQYYGFAGRNPSSTVSVGSVGKERTITNVAAGRIAADSTDAINGSELFATNSALGDLSYNVSNFAGDTSYSYTYNSGIGIRYVRTNEAGLSQSDSSAQGMGSTAVGYEATSLGDSSLALGREARANNANDVALGAGSVTAAAVGTAGVTIRGDYYGFAGTAPASTVSVGSVGHERTITNLAAGRITASSTDAINGSQLFATNKAIDNLNLNVDVVDKSAVKYVTNTDGSINYNSVVMAGDTYNSVTKTGGTRINNVAYGIDPSDAVNVQQLNEATTNIYTSGVKYFHANSSKVDSIASGSDSIAVGPAAVASGTSAIAVGDGALAQGKGSTAVGQGAVASADGSVAIGKGASDNGRGAETYTGKYSGAQNVTAGTVSVGNAATGETRTISNVADAKQATDAVNLRQLDGAVVQSNQYTDNSISNVNNSIVNVDKKITNVDNRVTKVEGDVSNIQNGTDGMFQTNNTSNLPKPKPTGRDAVAGGAGAVASAANSVAIGTSAKATADNSVALGNDSVADRSNSVSVGSAGAERQITNVAAGTANTDAVNVAQLNKSVGDITNIANDYTDKRYNQLKNDLDKQDDVLSAGIAGAMAMASLPQPYAPGASMAAAGMGTYRGQGAVAVGVSRISDNGKWVTKMQGSTTTQGDLGVSVGVGYQW